MLQGQCRSSENVSFGVAAAKQNSQAGSKAQTCCSGALVIAFVVKHGYMNKSFDTHVSSTLLLNI